MRLIVPKLKQTYGVRAPMMHLLNLYWVWTLFYYCFGKIKWSIPSYTLLISYTLLCYLCINIGYYSLRKKHVRINESDRLFFKVNTFKYFKRLFRTSCISFIIFQIAWTMVIMGSFNILNVFQNLGSNYFERLETQIAGTSVIMQLRTLFWFLTYFVYPVGFTYFKEMGTADRALFIATAATDILASLNMGISKNIGDIVIILVAVLMLHSDTTNRSREDKKQFQKKIRTIVTSIFVLFLVFSIIQDKRFEAMGKNVVTVTCNPRFGEVRDVSFLDIICLGNSTMVYLIHSLCNYFSSSYTALGLSFTLPFKSTYGLGFSRALMEYMNQYFNITVSANTYCQQLEDVYGWLNGISWPTAFVWIANAVSLVGVPFVMLVLGRIWARAEIVWKNERKLIALIVYCQLVIAFVFLPCNAQIVQSRNSFIATTMMFVFFFCRNIRFKWKNKLFGNNSLECLIENQE